MTNDVPSGNRSVVLLQDATLRASGGLTAWRESVHVTFTELGEDVHTIVRNPLLDANSGAGNGAGNGSGNGANWAGQSGVSGTVPRPARRSFLERALRRAGRVGLRYGRAAARRVPGLTRAGRTALGRVTGRGAPPAPPSKEPETPESTPKGRAELAANPQLAGLATADLVLAETPDTALAAAAVGVPKARLWLLAVPIERAGPGEPVPWAEGLREAAPVVGGMLVDTLDAAGVIERVAAPDQISVVPPIATDRTYAEEARAHPVPPLRTLNVFPDDLAGHLELWWSLLRLDPADATAYSFPVARFRGEAGPWREPTLAAWGEPADRSLGEPPEPWTADRQRSGLRRVLDLLPGRLPTRNGAAPGTSSDAGTGSETGSGSESGTDDGVHRVGVFGFDMKFFRDLAARLDTREDLDVVVDEWPSAGRRNEGVTEPLARSAPTLVAEWARPNAVWLAQNKRPEQRLIVRLHRFEIETEHPRRLDIDAVDAVVTIAPLMGRRIRDELGWPAEKLVYVPNFVDVPRLDRPKYPGARFTLGMVSIVPGLKRFDLALDLLAAIRREDPRFTLLVRSATAWTHKPSWQLAEERHLVQRFTERIEKDPWLRGAVVFDAFGKDMATWYRKVGHILSLSDLEGSHTALSEGMASGAVPVLRGWAGAEEVYGAHWVRPSLAAAAEEVLAAADEDVWRDRSARARADAAERFDPSGVVAAWEDLVRGRIEDARARFAAYADLGA